VTKVPKCNVRGGGEKTSNIEKSLNGGEPGGWSVPGIGKRPKKVGWLRERKDNGKVGPQMGGEGKRR